MTNIFSFLKYHTQQKPWLIIGKGPTFSHIKNIDTENYTTIALNHVIREIKVDFVHLIDFDVFINCQNDILRNANYLIMPMYPHFNSLPTKRNLKELVKDFPTLQSLHAQDRLLWYNHLPRRCLFSKKVNVIHFSAEAVVDIIAKAGYRKLYTLGIDGGEQYSSRFDDLKELTLLKNQKSSFDLQFDHIRTMMLRHDLELEPLVTQYPIKVYVATQEEQMLAVKVLEYSIRKHTDAPVEVFPLHKNSITYSEPKEIENRQRTPFSFQRFLIPELNGYSGKAIYLDSDMQVFTDIKKLWNLPMGTHDVLTVIPEEKELRKLQFSVMLLDCFKLDWSVQEIINKLDRHELTYSDLMYEMKIARNLGIEIPKIWNCLEWYKEGVSSLVHYTDMETQPWISTLNPLCHLWIADLIEAIECGFIDIEYVKDHINKGYIRPSLIYQIDNKHLASLTLPKEIKALDEHFKAPYKSLHIHTGTPYRNIFHRIASRTKKKLKTFIGSM